MSEEDEKQTKPIRNILVFNDALPCFKFFDNLLGIAFGLNCNFPVRDVFAYFVWTERVRLLKGKTSGGLE